MGLSQVNGDLVFDRSRLLFENVTAESGGGQLTLSGSVTYGEEGPMRYEITARTPQVRIRYPAGMSWLAGGTLQLSGTTERAVLSGNVELKRLLFAQGVDIASFFGASPESSAAPRLRSPFMRNLTFDVAAQTNPGARIEWTGAQVEMDGDVRLRGTWDRPVLLGTYPFARRRNVVPRQRLSRSLAATSISPIRSGSIPVLNVEATSTISQYQVTIDFSGPASQLALNYRSDPPLPDTRHHRAARAGQHRGGKRAAFLAPRRRTTARRRCFPKRFPADLGGRIEHLFGISQFRVDPFLAGTATESNAAARVTIEQQVTRDLTDHLLHQRRVQPVAVDSGGIRREARPLGCVPARHQRHLRPRHQMGQALQVKIYSADHSSPASQRVIPARAARAMEVAGRESAAIFP